MFVRTVLGSILFKKLRSIFAAMLLIPLLGWADSIIIENGKKYVRDTQGNKLRIWIEQGVENKGKLFYEKRTWQMQFCSRCNKTHHKHVVSKQYIERGNKLLSSLFDHYRNVQFAGKNWNEIPSWFQDVFRQYQQAPLQAGNRPTKVTSVSPRLNSSPKTQNSHVQGQSGNKAQRHIVRRPTSTAQSTDPRDPRFLSAEKHDPYLDGCRSAREKNKRTNELSELSRQGSVKGGKSIPSSSYRYRAHHPNLRSDSILVLSHSLTEEMEIDFQKAFNKKMSLQHINSIHAFRTKDGNKLLSIRLVMFDKDGNRWRGRLFYRIGKSATDTCFVGGHTTSVPSKTLRDIGFPKRELEYTRGLLVLHSSTRTNCLFYGDHPLEHYNSQIVLRDILREESTCNDQVRQKVWHQTSQLPPIPRPNAYQPIGNF